MNTKLLEICVDSLESALRAASGGPDRLELCGHLMLGGVTPSPKLIRQVVARVEIPVNVLIRPRFGDFCFTEAEKEQTLWEIRDAVEAGAAGVVIGTLTPEGDLDKAFLTACMEAAQGRNVTLHRCFDVCRDPFAALEQAISLGIHTILTSGQASSAPLGVELLKKLRFQSGGRIHLMAGAGVSAKNIPELHAKTGITHFHLSGKKSEPGPMVFRREGVPMGLPMASEFDRQYTDAAAVRAARDAVDSINP